MVNDIGTRLYDQLKALPNEAARALRIAEVVGTVYSGQNVHAGSIVWRIRADTIRKLGTKGLLKVAQGCEGYTYGKLPDTK
jgi:hypothetical protein